MQIKFSHEYKKIHGQKTARLVDIEVCDRSDLSERFVGYDTVFVIDPAIGVCSEEVVGYFPLPVGKYMVLLFMGDHRIPFTTVRRYTETKFSYYKGNLGNTFEIAYVNHS
jgi:hypothetical protein